ncbi:hypothetical protein A8C56_21035 [Niabella ginsenosidivorans]|uniref:Uncharacterized protein n=1 Tax=Niabella ginsenosidivorans TaxID=1176587 RepID=A0A1A9I9D3_9BACT|nr:hypothetical protein A8C56_21035 [Niabella ginsenosidivorans]
MSFNSFASTLVVSFGMLRSISLKCLLPFHIEISIKIFHFPLITSSVSLTGISMVKHSLCSFFFIAVFSDYQKVTDYNKKAKINNFALTILIIKKQQYDFTGKFNVALCYQKNERATGSAGKN